jgi:hypothetical protein
MLRIEGANERLRRSQLLAEPFCIREVEQRVTVVEGEIYVWDETGGQSNCSERS